ncbi:hypothetical protein MATL_G00203500 [Megalops atlanticus]|uniref:Uncharacterized protein n=1 Tax=Megalops atlanticus TaxID=7932 RepID=A0A9D3PKI7_MEGAT|nr:hypothetical protein MATL_G00203500 [Megalops atlanticus]
MDIRDSAGRWEALGSKDVRSREEAMENIRQEVMRSVENIGPMNEVLPAPGSAAVSLSDLNDVLARLLMLSKRCPYADVREKCAWVLQSVQVREQNGFEK